MEFVTYPRNSGHFQVEYYQKESERNNPLAFSISTPHALQWLFDPLRLAADVSLRHSGGAVREAPDPCLPSGGGARCAHWAERTLPVSPRCGLPAPPKAGTKKPPVLCLQEGQGTGGFVFNVRVVFRICEAAGDRSLFPPGGKKKMVFGRGVY